MSLYENDAQMRERGRAVTDAEKREVLERIYKVWISNDNMRQLRLGQMLSQATLDMHVYHVEDTKLAERCEKLKR